VFCIPLDHITEIIELFNLLFRELLHQKLIFTDRAKNRNQILPAKDPERKYFAGFFPESANGHI
jgi:hypothetical protein